jgi:hypothetical protein
LGSLWKKYISCTNNWATFFPVPQKWIGLHFGRLFANASGRPEAGASKAKQSTATAGRLQKRKKEKREMQIKQEKTNSFERKTVRARRKLRVLRVVRPGANPAITSGNASVVKIYKKTNSLERL